MTRSPKKYGRPKKARRLYLHRCGEAKEPVARPAYDSSFKPSADYLAEMPDMNWANGAVEGANVPIHQVGVSNFRLPLLYPVKKGRPITLETSVTGTVSVAANIKGINMSRIVRSFYRHKKEVFTPDTLVKILKAYRKDVGGLEARLRISFAFPLEQKSLRSGENGYQYYDVSFEASLNKSGQARRFMSFDFIYSSACPCSAELAEHARSVRGVYSIPHSQRSRARVTVEIVPGKKILIEDMQALCARALKTETQVIVRREDEQAFAEMNGAYVKFVEDAVRLIYQELGGDPRIKDFEVACAHFESLHSHDAVSVICKGVPGGFRADFMDFRSLVC